MTVDLTFRDADALAQHLTAVHWAGGRDHPPDPGWAILAELSEYAHATLTGLHLTGRGSGRLLTGYPDRVTALAAHADGVIDVAAEDGTRWRDRLDHGTATTTPPEANFEADPLVEAATPGPGPGWSPRSRGGAGVGR